MDSALERDKGEKMRSLKVLSVLFDVYAVVMFCLMAMFAGLGLWELSGVHLALGVASHVAALRVRKLNDL